MDEHDKILEIIRLKDQAPLHFEPDRSALLVIDVQRYFVNPQYPFARVLERLVSGATRNYLRRVHETVLPNINRLLRVFRTHMRPVIFTGTGSYTENGAELPQWLKD